METVSPDPQSSTSLETTPAPPERGRLRLHLRSWVSIRSPVPTWQAVLLGLACVALVFGLWWSVTRGPVTERVFGPSTLPSPEETFAEFKSLWFDRALTRNTLATLRRVTLGFALAAAVGIPLGVLAGCFTRFDAFLAPLTIFGRNIPLAALIPLTFAFFGAQELQKVMFIFIACVAFIVGDTAHAVAAVGREYIDTAYTLGAGRRQAILKVLVPLALPSVFNSLRLLFGLAFGYIMLAEMIKFGSEEGGLGYLILNSQRRGMTEHIYLIVLFIPLLALAIDRLLYWIQRELFPHKYGGAGILNGCVRALLHVWDDLKRLLWQPRLPEHIQARLAAARTNPGSEA
ncbi:MAG TPA: ABC transporter permease [Planctomycetaceae bacterium]|nr:ABC transporter permease [Planctomycetaceae bacterium]